MSTSTKSVEEVHRGRGRPRCEDSRARILEAGLELLEQFSFAEITADAIAERAGSSKATIYRWWPDKDAVLIEALREAVAQELPFPDTGDLREDIRQNLHNFIKLLAGRRGRIFTAFVAAAQSDPEVAETFQRVWREPRRKYLISLLERHRGKQMCQDADLEMVLDALYGPLYYRLLTGNRKFREGYADALTDIVLQGIANRAPLG
ncbi:MAG TPA: TetR/AcrR family transcriptional regulator [Candidatus Sulfotelmatobacter sp.]|nr:TetR/AcrR family transcriptional regulator [Candidatus Sulfotelmatobacter sp.]